MGIQPTFVVNIALLSLADNLTQFLDWVGRLDEMLIVPLPPTEQPLHKTRHPQPRARTMSDYATISGNIKWESDPTTHDTRRWPRASTTDVRGLQTGRSVVPA
jgi:hypothetical protein